MKPLALLILAFALPLAAAAQVVFPKPDAEGCFAIAEDFTFCGEKLGWVGSGSSHPDITAYFLGSEENESLVFSIFDPEHATLGAFKGDPTAPLADLIAEKREAHGLFEPLNNGVPKDSSLAGFDARTLTMTHDGHDGTVTYTVYTEVIGEPWLLFVNTGTTKSAEVARDRHAAVLEALNIDK